MLKTIAAASVAAILVGSALPASAQTATTPSPNAETITGARTVSLPTPPVAGAYFTLPIKTSIAKDASITTNTPITDKATSVSAWGEAIRACLKEKPMLMREAKGQASEAVMVPFMVGDGEARIKLNANDRPVCPG